MIIISAKFLISNIAFRKIRRLRTGDGSRGQGTVLCLSTTFQ